MWISHNVAAPLVSPTSQILLPWIERLQRHEKPNLCNRHQLRKRNFTKVKQRAKTKTQRKLFKFVWRRSMHNFLVVSAHRKHFVRGYEYCSSARKYLPALLVFNLGCFVSHVNQLYYHIGCTLHVSSLLMNTQWFRHSTINLFL